MAAKSRLISFSQILASKILLLFVPTSANSFSIWGVEMLATYGLTIWGLQDSRWLKVGTTLASSELIRPWQGSPVFVGQHRWSQYSQWSRPAIKLVNGTLSYVPNPPRQLPNSALIYTYLSIVSLNREISAKPHLAREIDNVLVDEHSTTPWVSYVESSDLPPTYLNNQPFWRLKLRFEHFGMTCFLW